MNVGEWLGEAEGCGVGLLIVVVMSTEAPTVTIKTESTVNVVEDVTAVTVDVDEPTVTVEPTEAPEVDTTVSVVDELEAVAVVV